MDDRGRRRLVVPLLDLRPQAPEELDVRGQILLALALRVRAHDEPARRRVQGADDAAQALALVLVVDAPRDADVVRLRHVDEIAPGQGDERGDTGALGPQRLLGDLDQHLLSFAQDVLDGRRGLAAGRDLVHVEVAAVLVRAGEHEPLVVADVGRVVAGIEEGVLAEPDVDERGLHARQDVRHHAPADVADDRSVPAALDVEAGEEVSLLESDARFEDADIDDDPLGHGSTS